MQTLRLGFCASVPTRNELEGNKYLACTFLECCETKLSAESFIFKIFHSWRSLTRLQRNVYGVMFAAWNWQMNEKMINQNVEKSSQMINLTRLTLCSYFANVLGFECLLIRLDNTCSFSRLFSISFCEIENLHYYAFQRYIVCRAFIQNGTRTYISEGHPRRCSKAD